jgi:hypothetical protein
MMNAAAMIRLRHHPTGAPGQGDGGGDGGQVVADHDRVGGLQGQVAAGATHRDPGVRRGQGRGVVDAVPDNVRVDLLRRPLVHRHPVDSGAGPPR